MICTCIQHKNLEEIFEILRTVEMAEIRLDRCTLDDEEIEALFSSSDVPLVATCRIEESPDTETVLRKLSIAARAGATIIDLEMDAPAGIGKKMRRICLDCGSSFMRSFHDFCGTPSEERLQEILCDCRRFGGDYVKIAVTANGEDDWTAVKRLYDNAPEGSLVAFCMGEAGKGSRLECLKMGAPFTYAALSKEDAAAPGQWLCKQMAKALYGDKHLYDNCITVPSSKSFAQRAIIAAALSKGTSKLGSFTPCSDSNSAIKVAEALGAKIEFDGDSLIINGLGKDSIPELENLNVGESGLLARLMIPLMAVFGKAPVKIEGEGTLLKRPLSCANDIMAAFGVMLTNAAPQSVKEVFVPLNVSGKLLSGLAEISGKGGSQLISGLLMSLPLLEKGSTVYITDPKSIPYMFITLDVLRKFGIKIANEMEGDDVFLEKEDWSHCSGMTFHIEPGQSYHSADFHIEGDWSSAANFMVLGAIYGNVCVKGLDTSSLQADLTIIDILVEAGASVSQDEDGSINVHKAPLQEFHADLNNAPDLFPVVSVLAAFCPGKSRIEGISRLYGKESDRSISILNMLKGFGVEACIDSDALLVQGHSLSWRILNGQLLKGGEYSSYHDHRMAMALKVAEPGADSSISIDDTDCLEKSYPDFLKDLY